MQNIDPIFFEKCQLYLYQTEAKGYYKFGISKDHTRRAKNAREEERRRYNKFIWALECSSRAEAMCIESIMKQNISINAGQLFARSREAFNILYCSYDNPIGNGYKSALDPDHTRVWTFKNTVFKKRTELTKASQTSFKEFALELHDLYNELDDPIKFLNLRKSEELEVHQKKAENLIKGKWSVLMDEDNVMVIGNPTRLRFPFDSYRKIRLLEVPKHFNKHYGDRFKPML